MKEVRLSVESVAIHIPGERNVTPDALSRYYFNNEFRDKNPDRTLRKRLFQSIEKVVGTFTLDGMVADDGHNWLVKEFCTPSNPLFEANLEDHMIWVFPPLELIGVTLKFLVTQHKAKANFSCCVLVPERSSAYWYKFLTNFRPVERYGPGSDLFRVWNGTAFVRSPPVKEYWRVLVL